MKKRIGIASVLLAAGMSLTLAGCSGSSQNVVYLSSNWYANTGFKKIQPTFTEGNDNFAKEKITYDVKFDKSTASNSTYSVNYADGTYVTEFYAKSFDRNSEYVHEDYKNGYPDKNLTVYYYRTELTIPSVTFKVGNEEKTFVNGNGVVCESYFLSVEDRMRPLYSSQKINSVSPANYQVSSIDEAYRELNYEYKTYYNFSGSEAKTYAKTDGGEDTVNTVYGINQSANTLFDVSYLDIAVRANKLMPDLAQAISLYTPHGGVQDFILRGSDTALTDDEAANAKSILTGKNLYTPEYAKDENGKEVEKKFSTVAVSVTYNGELSGVSQTYWFAAVNNARNNVGRATIVKMSYPVTFGLGTQIYTLNEIESTLWTD
ncbi:MAG: hypothetical protein K2K80_04605 [Clostridia bacterium]|nr:hypothetical protein [Clostridia bacterium]